MKLYCWNTNGIRAAARHGMLDWLTTVSPDILCIQETKVSDTSVLAPEVFVPEGYNSYWNWPAEKKGYSGVCIYTKEKPLKVEKGFGIAQWDGEGRVLVAHYDSFVLLNVYFPNGKQNADRLAYKMGFYDAFLSFCDNLKKQKKRLVMCGDYNTAHTEIDLAHPKENQNTSGFLPQERAWLDTYIAHGYVDTLRMFHPEAGLYSWWDVKTRARERNVGWRIDYVFVSDTLKDNVADAFICADVTGSDHCPIGVDIAV